MNIYNHIAHVTLSILIYCSFGYAQPPGHYSRFIEGTQIGVREIPHPFAVFSKGGAITVLMQEGPITQPGYESPKSEYDNIKTVFDLRERLSHNPQVIARKIIYPALFERALIESRKQKFDINPGSPYFQIFDSWLGCCCANYYEISENLRQNRMNIGKVFLFSYSWPPMSGAFVEHYKQPPADLVKPFLFFIDGQYYTVYGDTQLAEHLPLPDHPEQLAAFRYAGNILYAYSSELPPALQSCGVDVHDNIWIVDQDHHLAVFQTNSREFIQQIIDFHTSRTLVARDNLSGSIFTQGGPEAVFQEIGVSVTDTLTTSALDNPRTLPSGTQHVLFSSADQLTYVADRMLKLDHLDPKQNRSAEIEMAEDEYVMEGVYVPETRKAAFLIARRVKEHPSMIEEVRKSWQHMRVVYLQLME